MEGLNSKNKNIKGGGSKLAKIRPRQKQIILPSRIAIFLLKGSFKRGKIILRTKFRTQTNNFINKFYLYLNTFSYCFKPNFQKLCDFNKSQIIFSGRKFSET